MHFYAVAVFAVSMTQGLSLSLSHPPTNLELVNALMIRDTFGLCLLQMHAYPCVFGGKSLERSIHSINVSILQNRVSCAIKAPQGDTELNTDYHPV